VGLKARKGRDLPDLPDPKESVFDGIARQGDLPPGLVNRNPLGTWIEL
jgi:hypothetical protein